VAGRVRRGAGVGGFQEEVQFRGASDRAAAQGDAVRARVGQGVRLKVVGDGWARVCDGRRTPSPLLSPILLRAACRRSARPTAAARAPAPRRPPTSGGRRRRPRCGRQTGDGEGGAVVVGGARATATAQANPSSLSPPRLTTPPLSPSYPGATGPTPACRMSSCCARSAPCGVCAASGGGSPGVAATAPASEREDETGTSQNCEARAARASARPAARSGTTIRDARAENAARRRPLARPPDGESAPDERTVRTEAGAADCAARRRPPSLTLLAARRPSRPVPPTPPFGRHLHLPAARRAPAPAAAMASATLDRFPYSSAPVRRVKAIHFGVLDPDFIVSEREREEGRAGGGARGGGAPARRRAPARARPVRSRAAAAASERGSTATARGGRGRGRPSARRPGALAAAPAPAIARPPPAARPTPRARQSLVVAPRAAGERRGEAVARSVSLPSAHLPPSPPPRSAATRSPRSSPAKRTTKAAPSWAASPTRASARSTARSSARPTARASPTRPATLATSTLRLRSTTSAS